MTTQRAFVAELVAYTGAGTSTLYMSTHGFSSLPTDTPASTFIDGRITQSADMRRTLFGQGTTWGRSAVGFGDLVLANDDGALDAWLAYGFDGRSITIRTGVPGAAYPSAWTTVLVGVMEQAVFDARTVTIKVRDKIFTQVQTPFQTTKFAGTNTLPTGLEGVATDLKGKPKPVTLGKVFNASLPCVNTSKLIYQVSDGAVASVDAVYDKGVNLGYLPVKWADSSANLGGGAASPMQGAAYGAGVWVVGGNGGDTYVSSDRTTWTKNTIAATGALVGGMAFGNSLFIAGDFASKAMVTSPDGTTWTRRTTGLAGIGGSGMLAVCWSSRLSLFIAGSNGGGIATSPDGTTWTVRTSAFAGGNVNGIADGANVLIAVGQTAGVVAQIMSSPDGITWTSVTDFPWTGAGFAMENVVYGGGYFVATGNTFGARGASIGRSKDGLHWTDTSGVFTQLTALHGLAFAEGIFVVGGTGSATQKAGYSLDGGATWIVMPAPAFTGASDGIRAFTAGPGGWIATGNNAAGFGAVEVMLGMETFAAFADLTDDTKAPVAGGVSAFLGGGGNGAYIRLGSPPAGTITADVTQGATAADRTAAQLFKAVLTRAGYSATDWTAADFTTLDGLTTAVCGLYIDNETTYADVLDAIAASVGAWWGISAAGKFRLARVDAPTGTAVASFTANDLKRRLARSAADLSASAGRGLPCYAVIVEYARNYTVQSKTDLAGGVTDARAGVLAQDYATTRDTDASVQTAHLLAPELTFTTALTAASDAATEATRILSLRKTRRDVYPLLLDFDDAASIDLGDTISLSHARFGLSAGQKFLVIGVEPNARDRSILLTVWG